jgi:hypothetical protein
MDRKKIFLIFVLCISIMAKIFLLGKGYLSLPDEFRYIAAQDFIEFFKKGEFKTALSQLFEVQGRPGLVIAAILPAGMQIGISNYLLLPYNSPTSAWVIYIYNVLVYLLILRNIFRLCNKFGFTIYQSLLVLIVYTFTLNSFIYLRHTFPYDTALLLGLMAFNLVISKNAKSIFSILCQGLSISACFLIYPGFFPIVLSFAIFWLYQNKDSFHGKLWIKRGLLLLLAFLIPFFIVEVLASMCGKSYFLDAKQLSQTIIEGSFEEGFSFLFKYLWQVESGIGIFYILGLLGFVFVILRKAIQTRENLNQTEWLFISITTGFLFYASLVFFVHKMVFYGRIIHQFVPFLALFTVFAMFQLVQSERLKKQLIWVLPFLLVGLSVNAYRQYVALEYPRDFFHKVNRNGALKARSIDYSCQWFSSLPRIEKFGDTNCIKHDKIILVNWCHPSGDSVQNGKIWNRFIPVHGQKLIARAPHYMSYIGYQFEGANIKQREDLRVFPPLLEIYAEN